MLQPSDFFNLDHAVLKLIFADCAYVWDVLPRLESHFEKLTKGMQTIHGTVMKGAYLSDRAIYIGEGAVIEPGAYIEGPAYIATRAVVRHGAYVRENALILSDAIVGHASEIKNSILLPHAAAPHFNYVGDSILGARVNLGAGTKLSNLALTSEKDERGKRPTIKIQIGEEIYDTGLTKLGAILGDDAQTGCNAVLNPGTLIGPHTMVYPNMSVRKGYYPPHSVLKLRQTTKVMPKR